MKPEEIDSAVISLFVILGLTALVAAYKFEAMMFFAIVFFLDCEIFGLICIIRKRITFRAFTFYGLTAIIISSLFMMVGLLVLIIYFFF